MTGLMPSSWPRSVFSDGYIIFGFTSNFSKTKLRRKIRTVSIWDVTFVVRYRENMCLRLQGKRVRLPYQISNNSLPCDGLYSKVYVGVLISP